MSQQIEVGFSPEELLTKFFDSINKYPYGPRGTEVYRIEVYYLAR